MAASAVLPAMSGDKLLHPFFTKPATQVPNGAASHEDITDAAEIVQDSTDADSKPKRKRKPKSKDGKSQKTLQELVNPKPINVPEDNSDTKALVSGRPDKRRRTSQDEFIEINGETGTDGSAAASPTRKRMVSPQAIIPASSPLPTGPSAEAIEHHAKAKTPPKKLLRLNASGKFSSPPSKKVKDEEQPESAKRRGRPRKSKEPAAPKTLPVIVRYAKDSNVGYRIDRVMRGDDRVTLPVPCTPKKPRTPRKQKVAKPTPPFFAGKPKESLSARKKESPRKTSAVTPGKLKRQTLSDIHSKQVPEANDTWTSSLLKDRLMMKHPGAKEPAWPDKESVHVRGTEDDIISATLPHGHASQLQKRKRKNIQKYVGDSDSILSRYASNLAPEEVGRLRNDGFREPHPSLSVPRRLLEPGAWLACKVRGELKISSTTDPGGPSLIPTHPALRKLHDSVPHTLSAFDEGRGENAIWTQKYAPATAAEVLQPSNEMIILKNWLRSLTITAVEGSSRPDSKLITRAEVKLRKKRKRRTDEMHDFLVDSDEEVHDMVELPDEELKKDVNKGHPGLASIVQVQADGVKLSNAALLIGPNGCGKTAAAYAVAKELGFKIFEISPCERRSGKDVLERIGDMTENHLVKHHGTDTAETSSNEEPGRFDEALQRDLESGRQGKMAAFFKPQVKVKSKLTKSQTPATAKQTALDALQKVIKKPAKDQQQSLILLEEVDVLFKDDKDFWTTVFRLMSTSKRPIIMTCNDEELVPLQAISLHAILRFQPASTDLAVDYLLLLAAVEGHCLTREAVLSLYTSHHRDLRATITELQFWCQMGVGDPKGGLSWIYQRYPPGSDLNEDGQRLRVVSKDTFQKHMGHSPPLALDEVDQLLWKWQELRADPLISLGWHEMGFHSLNEGMSVKSYASFAESMSAADVYCGNYHDLDLDTTQRSLPDKSRGQYIEGLRLLQTDTIPDYNHLRPSLAAATALSALRTANLTPHPHPTTGINPTLTRKSFTVFDPLATAPESNHLTPSALDAPLSALSTEIAPYIRSIISSDLALAAQRERLAEVLDGDHAGKSARKTRAARSALEGSQRGSTRRERWFNVDVDREGILKTGGEEWAGVVEEVLRREREVMNQGSAEGERSNRDEMPSLSAGSEVLE